MKKFFIILIVLVLFAGGIYFFFKFGKSRPPQGAAAAAAVPDTSGAAQADIAQISKYQYTETYTSDDYGFSFKYPSDFTVQEIPNDDGSKAIIVQNVAKKIGVQILISKWTGPDQDITVDLVRSSVPDLSVSDPQELGVGVNRKGLAFLSDNPNFGGKSREVWFVWKGNLYQISTYIDLDDFLKGLFGTWKFTS